MGDASSYNTTIVDGPYKYLIFKDPNDATTPYHAINQITQVITKNALASTIFNTVFADSVNAAVHVANGTYLCLANVTFPTGISIIGESRASTIIRADTGWAGPTVNLWTNANGGVNAGNSNIYIANLTLDANNLAKDCLHLDRVWRSRVTNCYFTNARGFTVWWWGDLSTDTTPILAKENRFDNNILDCSFGNSDVFGGGRMVDSVIGPNNTFRDALVSGASGLVVQTNAIRLLVTGNHIFNTVVTGSGISLEAGHFCTVSNNIIHDITGVGIAVPMSPSGRGVEGSLTGNGNHCTITGNNIRDCGAGISTTGHGHHLDNNYIEGCKQQGIASSSGGTLLDTTPVAETDPGQISFNTIINCGKNTGASSVTRSGIQVDGSSGLVNNLIIGNVIYDNQGTPTMNYGIYESTPSDGNLFAYNYISPNMLIQTIRKIGTNSIIITGAGGGGGTGEANTASNVGSGLGLFKIKTGVDLPFKSLTATSSKIALANNTNDIGIDVTEANLTLQNLAGLLPVAKGGTGLTTRGDVGITNADSPYAAPATVKYIRVDASAGAITIDLPTATGILGYEYHIFRTDIIQSTNLVIIDPNGTETVDSCGTYILYPAEWVKIESDGANWQVIDRPTPSRTSGYFFRKGSTIDRRYTSSITASNNAVSTTSPAANLLWALPFVVSKTVKFDTISFRVTTLSTSGSARAGIYRDDGNCYPGALIFDTGSIDTSTGSITTSRDTAIPTNLQVFQPGLYWLAWETNSATGQYNSFIGGIVGISSILGSDVLLGTSNPAYGYSVTHTFGALPDPYSAGANILSTAPTASAPLVTVGLRPI